MCQRDVRHKSCDLTADEQKNIRAALAHLRKRVGGWEALGRVLHYDGASLIHVVACRKNASPTMAFRIARLVKVGIDDLLTGKFPPPGTCSNCGHCEDAVTR